MYDDNECEYCYQPLSEMSHDDYFYGFRGTHTYYVCENEECEG